MVVIRVARPEDVVHFPEIERVSGSAFRERDMASIADDGPLPAHELLAYQRAGRAWVATDDVDEPVAYLVLDIVDEFTHVEQVSVDPAYAHHRLGQALLDAEAAWAHEQGLGAMTLTTFADVTWNAPYYVRLGVCVVLTHSAKPSAVITSVCGSSPKPSSCSPGPHSSWEASQPS